MSTPESLVGADTQTNFSADDLASALDSSSTTTQDPGTTATAPAGATQSGEQNANQSSLEAPKHWSDEVKALFGKVPPEVQNHWLNWDKHQARSYDTKFQELAGFRRERDRLDEIFQPYSRDLELQGVDRMQFMQSLLGGHKYLLESPREAMTWLAQQYGVDLAELTSQPEQTDPKLAGLMSKISGLEQQLTGFTSTAKQREQQERVGQVRAFAEAKGADGKPLRPYWEQLKGEVLNLVKSGVNDVEKAYNIALRGNEEIFSKHQAEQSLSKQKAEDAKRLQDIDKAKRAAAGNEGRSTGSASEKSLDAELRDAFASWGN